MTAFPIAQLFDQVVWPINRNCVLYLRRLGLALLPCRQGLEYADYITYKETHLKKGLVLHSSISWGVRQILSLSWRGMVNIMHLWLKLNKKKKKSVTTWFLPVTSSLTTYVITSFRDTWRSKSLNGDSRHPTNLKILFFIKSRQYRWQGLNKRYRTIERSFKLV